MEKIRRSVAYNIYTGGGLGIFHVPSRIAAFRVKHLATFISSREKPWVPFAVYWIGIPMRNFLPNVSLNSSPHAATGPQDFYKYAIQQLHSFLDAGWSLTNSPSLTMQNSIQNLFSLNSHNSKMYRNNSHRQDSSLEET
jgi:hypothetical protein